MSTLILLPKNADKAHLHAANVLRDTYAEITGKRLCISDSDDAVSDLFVVGSDGVNDFVMNAYLDGKIECLGIRYGTDDYALLSYKDEKRRIIVFAGGRGRSTVYAVYDFFSRFFGCRYFWDGDVIPKSEEKSFDDFHIVESPRFEYRGLRYFAHRGLFRFQAEHWSLADWKRELDYLMKKRLNFFMLRIGMDDVWQRAFPDAVEYPDGYFSVGDEYGYNDRSDFWSLRYRGELREKILEYARDLDLIYPTDCGTMTHWYSRTPNAFLEKKKPSFLPQCNRQYDECDTGKVFDFRESENMDHYMHLTETMVNEYEKRTHYFHTIGLGERLIFADKKKNHRLKLIAYRRIAENLRRRYPDSKLFLASWDFICWWDPSEVEALVRELDPERTVILDYTSETNDPNDTFLGWGVVNKFPWVFGLFHAYASESELRGPYARTEERLRIAANDPYCKGMILWPELSHSDPIVLEYLAENAWSPLKRPIEELLTAFCKDRYGAKWREMDVCWQKFLPFMMLGDWGGYSRRKKGDPLAAEYYSHWLSHSDLWVKPLDALKLRKDARYEQQLALKLAALRKTLPGVTDAAKILASEAETWNDPFFRRDAIDILRTALGRGLNFLFAVALYEKDAEKTEAIRTVYFTVFDALSALLSQSEDFSVAATLSTVRKTAPTNPDFEKTLKENIGCDYCRQYAYELMELLYRKEAALAFDTVIDEQRGKEPPCIDEQRKEILSVYAKTPLDTVTPTVAYTPAEVLKNAENALDALSAMLS